jgi:hypothetical protein
MYFAQETFTNDERSNSLNALAFDPFTQTPLRGLSEYQVYLTTITKFVMGCYEWE